MRGGGPAWAAVAVAGGQAYREEQEGEKLLGPPPTSLQVDSAPLSAPSRTSSGGSQGDRPGEGGESVRRKPGLFAKCLSTAYTRENSAQEPDHGRRRRKRRVGEEGKEKEKRKISRERKGKKGRWLRG